MQTSIWVKKIYALSTMYLIYAFKLWTVEIANGFYP